MKRAHLLLVAALALSIVAIAAVADALVVTDEERIEAIVELADGELSRARIDDALAYVRTDRAPFELRAGTRQRVYDDRDAELGERAHSAARDLLGTEMELVQHDARVDGDQAVVHARVRTSQGIVNITADLEKVGGRWLAVRATFR